MVTVVLLSVVFDVVFEVVLLVVLEGLVVFVVVFVVELLVPFVVLLEVPLVLLEVQLGSEGLVVQLTVVLLVVFVLFGRGAGTIERFIW